MKNNEITKSNFENKKINLEAKNTEKTIVTAQEIANDLHVNLNYVYDLIATDRIKYFKIGNAYKIRYTWYQNFLEECQGKTLPSYKQLESEARIARKAKEVA